MSLKDKLEKKKQKLKMQMQKGQEVSEQMRAEKLRKKKQSIKNAKPSTISSVRTGLFLKQSPLEVMKVEYDRRKYERKNKFNKEDFD